MPADLETLDAELDSTTLALLGDTITYTPQGGGPLSFKAIVDYGDNAEMLSGSRVMSGDCAVEVPIATIALPTGEDVLDLPKRPTERFQPKEWKRDETGRSWLILLKLKAA